MTDYEASPLFRAFPDPLVYYRVEDGAPVVGTVNDSFEEAFAVREADVAGETLVEHLPDARTTSLNDRAATAGAGTVGSDDGVTADSAVDELLDGRRLLVRTGESRDDDSRSFHLRNVTVSDGGGEGYLVYTEVTDVERRARDAESRAERAERFASVASHDLRNPIEVARIRLEAARETGEDVHFEKVDGALDRIHRIVQSVLSVSSGSVDSDGTVSVTDLAEAAWSTVDTADATLDVEPDAPTVAADADHVRQLLENLYRNAVEHGGADVTVTVGPTEGGFYVGDDGPGIPPRDRTAAFDPGYSTVEGNTGLGLAIVEQVADAHGWRVSVGTMDGGGARFEFTGVDVLESASG